MSDEQDKPEKMRMPRLPGKRKPEPKRDLRKKDVDKLYEVELEQMILSVDERACAHLATEYSKEHAATVLGWTLAAVEDTLNLPHVRLYLKKADEAFLKEVAKAKVRRMTKVGISRAAIEERLMALAQMDPTDTRGSIDGQVKALRTLAEIYGMLDKDDPLKNKSREELVAILSRNRHVLTGNVDAAVH